MPAKIWNVLIHRKGNCPWERSEYSFGEKRAAALRNFKENGTFPKGIVAYDALSGQEITCPEMVEWPTMSCPETPLESIDRLLANNEEIADELIGKYEVLRRELRRLRTQRAHLTAKRCKIIDTQMPTY